MKKIYVCLIVLFIPFYSVQSQIKFKPQLEAAAGFEKDAFFLANWGLGIEKKIDINKSIETGIYYHNFEFNFPKDRYGFYEAFVKNSRDSVYQDSISDYRVVFNFLSIPVGYNYYISPKTYLSYKLGFNFFTSSTYQGFFVLNNDYSETGYVYKTRFPNSVFKKFYVSHDISINTIILRRIDVGLSFVFTKSGFFKNLNNDVYRTFNKEVSKYFAVGMNLKFFVFQVNSKKI